MTSGRSAPGGSRSARWAQYLGRRQATWQSAVLRRTGSVPAHLARRTPSHSLHTGGYARRIQRPEQPMQPPQRLRPEVQPRLLARGTRSASQCSDAEDVDIATRRAAPPTSV
eukprot:scaffold1232_cov127-Isochrysis_galbana.AAC.7